MVSGDLVLGDAVLDFGVEAVGGADEGDFGVGVEGVQDTPCCDLSVCFSFIMQNI